MDFKSLTNEVFAIRDHEYVEIERIRPTRRCRYIAVMLRSIEMPEGPRSPVRVVDNEPVVQAAVLGALWNAKMEYWQWCKLSSPTAEFIGDLMLLDPDLERDRWYYAVITDLNL